MEFFQGLLDAKIVHIGNFILSVYNLATIIMIVIIIKIFLMIVRYLLNLKVQRGRIDKGRAQAVRQLITYIVVIVAFLLILDSLGVRLTILLAGSAALLVGIGLGLQQLFLDFVSGIVVLSEGAVHVGDVVEVDSKIGKVQNVGFRTSQVRTLDNVIIIVPNSKFTSGQVINLTHTHKLTRFRIEVGVAYGVDIDKVADVLIECALEHVNVEKNPRPISRLADFGDSALKFQLLFWTLNSYGAEQLLADVRASIYKKFQENEIEIPFPQRVVHLKNKDV